MGPSGRKSRRVRGGGGEAGASSSLPSALALVLVFLAVRVLLLSCAPVLCSDSPRSGRRSGDQSRRERKPKDRRAEVSCLGRTQQDLDTPVLLPPCGSRDLQLSVGIAFEPLDAVLLQATPHSM